MKTKCGDSSYNTAAEFCDDGNVYAKCVGEVYGPDTATCEDNVLKTKCGNGFYNPASEFCDGGNIYAKCGANNYIPATEFCSGAGIYAKCDGEAYDPVTTTCESNVLKTKCGDSSYYPAAEFCDGGNVYSKCGADNYNPVAVFCDDGNVYAKCGGEVYDPASQICENDALKPKCGNSSYNPALEFCSGVNIYDKCNGNTYNPANQTCENNMLKTKFTDTRDSKSYTAIAIGSQTWMAENLNYDVPNNTTDVCYDGIAGNCLKYGRLYNWSTAMSSASSSSLSPSGVQGVCPAGWHIPSDAEWTELAVYAGVMAFVGGTATVATPLKSSTGWNSYSGVPAGTDEFGFAALPGGYGTSNGYFNDAGYSGSWWSATESRTSNAWDWNMGNMSQLWEHNDRDKTFLYSVRCVQNE
jgi:uncharacterized protein (TIGR02145 family)